MGSNTNTPSAISVHVPVIVKQIPRIRHDCIRREELAAIGIIVAGVEILQAAAIQLLTGKLVISGQRPAAAVATVGVVTLLVDKGAAVVGGVDRAAQVVAVEIHQGTTALTGGDARPIEEVILGSYAILDFIELAGIVDGFGAVALFDPLPIGVVEVAFVGAAAD